MTRRVASGKRKRRGYVHKPRGVVQDRVRAVGPDHFGIVCVDPAKARSWWMLTDFYGKVLIEPGCVEHTQAALRNMVALVRAACQTHDLRDHIVVIERTGNYHLPVRRAFLDAGSETRIVHPFATKQFRQADDPGDKTDPNDLAAIQRAGVNGFGLLEPLLEPPLEPLWEQLRLLSRHRRDLVQKKTTVCCQLREHLHLTMPGFAECFGDLWESEVGLAIARWAESPKAIVAAGVDGLAEVVHPLGVRFQRRTLEKIVAWAQQAAPAATSAPFRQRLVRDLDDDRKAKEAQIHAMERDLASSLIQTPYLLLLAIPGINVVSAADLAGEMGPIEHYGNANAITGRAGLFPSRSQSDTVDHADGPILRCANRRLRAALMQIADNLAQCNQHYRGKAALWKTKPVDARKVRVRIAKQFCRLAYSLVAGRQMFPHPACQKRHYILQKLMDFHLTHDTPMEQLLRDLNVATEQLPKNTHREEAATLAEKLKEINAGRGKGPKRLGLVLAQVLAKLGVGQIESSSSGGQDSG